MRSVSVTSFEQPMRTGYRRSAGLVDSAVSSACAACPTGWRAASGVISSEPSSSLRAYDPILNATSMANGVRRSSGSLRVTAVSSARGSTEVSIASSTAGQSLRSRPR